MLRRAFGRMGQQPLGGSEAIAAGDVVVVAHRSAVVTVGADRRVLNCRAMNATTPDRETSPPRRVSLVLHPRRDVQVAIDQVTAWARRTGTELAAVEDGRLPAEVRRCRARQLADVCDIVLALGGDGTMLGGLRLAAPLGVPVLGANLGRLGYLTEVDAEHLPEGLEALSAGAYAVEERFMLRAAMAAGRRSARTRRLQRRRPQPRAGARPGPPRAARRRPAARPLRQRRRDRRHARSGSTAYSYAAGGPIVSPQTRAMIVTPDAPHGLFNRAVVLGDEESLGVEVLPNSAPARSRPMASCSRRGRPRGGASTSPRIPGRRSSCGWAQPASPSARGASSASPIRPPWPTTTSPGTSDDRTRPGRHRHRRGLGHRPARPRWRCSATGYARRAGRPPRRGADATTAAPATRRARARRADRRRPTRRRSTRCSRACATTFGRLDLLFNNAGTAAPPVPLEDLTFERLAAVVDVNLTGAVPVHPGGVPADEGPEPARRADHQQRLDLGPRRRGPFAAAYTATKHAITGLTKATRARRPRATTSPAARSTSATPPPR